MEAGNRLPCKTRIGWGRGREGFGGGGEGKERGREGRCLDSVLNL